MIFITGFDKMLLQVKRVRASSVAYIQYWFGAMVLAAHVAFASGELYINTQSST